MENRCHLCHSIDSQEIPSKRDSDSVSDLSDIEGQNEDPGWWSRYLKREEPLDGTKHRRRFSGTEEELSTLVDWLLSLPDRSP